MKKLFLLVGVLGLAACKSDVITETRTITVNIPVPQPCADERPEQVTPLLERIPDPVWAPMDLVQRLAAFGVNAFNRMTYEEDLRTATAACPELD